jgi:sugar phosphate isomerase/epimerase
MVHVGLTSYAFTWEIGLAGYPQPPHPLDPASLIKEAHALNAKVLQICDNIDLTTLDTTELARLKDLAYKNEITIQVGFRGCELITVEKYLDIAEQLEARLIRMLIDLKTPGVTSESVVETLKKVVPRLERLGSVIAIENYDRCSSIDILRILAQLQSSSIGVCLDPANSLGVPENPYEVVSLLGPFSLCLHLKDVTIKRFPHQQGFLIEGCPLGEGQLDIIHILDTLFKKNSKLDIPVLLELWVPYRQSIEETIATEKQWRSSGLATLYQMLKTLKIGIQI